ncbi:calcium/proton exchanger [Paenibacillus spongiae]|uniref:Ca(2+)/H(+) antiporter n=1 Tax=Paenibacillus spongiae TaxID=2909671 RepID=A0ABY5S535_9BACL|nr:calcium/proton exchanger [Paenibacillus spongiae]UVI27858.1 calcium/proton exchanger [Paenibacillus spongiae]
MNQKLFFTALIVLFVLSGIAHFAHWSPIAQFILSALAILFVAGFLGKATESVAHYAGQRLGGFLNATFGNAAELIIAIFLVKEGLFDMVKASLTGAIIGNLLLVLGLSVLLGGLKFKEQKFNIQLASHNSSLMILAVIGLFVPAMFVMNQHFSPEKSELLSLSVAGILIVAYALWLVFSMVTHKNLLSEVEEAAGEHGESPAWSKGRSILFLIVATVMTAFVSEWLVGTLHTFTNEFGFSELFLGAFVIAIVGNAAEHSAAVLLAMKNKIGAAVEIAVGSSLQIALFVAPALVFISLLFGKPMDILFTPIEIAAIAVSVFIATSISKDGSTNWYEGVLLVMVYVILGFAFYFV